MFSQTLLLLTASVALFAQNSAQAKSDSQVVVINEDNWVNLLRGEWLVDFYAPWCPACKRLKPEWDKLVEWSNDLNIKVASADVTKYPGLSGRFMVSGLPTVYHVKDGLFRVYNGPREHEALINFVEEQKWKNIEPVSKLWSPDSLQMSALAYLFRASMALRDIHNYLTDEYGMPYYISYLLFAICTVLVGTLSGCLIVFVIDLFIPARYSRSADQQPRSQQQQSSSGGSKPKATKDKKNDSDLEDSQDSIANREIEATQNKNQTVRRRAN